MRWSWLVWLAWLVPAALSADGALTWRWQPGTTAISYSAIDGKEALATDVRALLQGAPLVDASGEPLRFESLTSTHSARSTAPLVCQGDESEAADGMIELTFSRKVRLGIEYTLGKCQLFYRCGAGRPGVAAAPQLYLGFVGGGAPVSRAAAPPSRD